MTRDLFALNGPHTCHRHLRPGYLLLVRARTQSSPTASRLQRLSARTAAIPLWLNLKLSSVCEASGALSVAQVWAPYSFGVNAIRGLIIYYMATG